MFIALDIEINDEDLGIMVDEVDEDGNGLIDFDEFVMVGSWSSV